MATVADAVGRRDLAELRWNWQAEQGEVPAMDRDEFIDRFGAWVVERERTHVAFLARDTDGDALGMAWLVIIERLPGPGRWERVNGYIPTVYVEPDARGRGVGEQLVRALIDEARRRALEILGVHPSERSRPFYARLGFAETPQAFELLLGTASTSDGPAESIA